MGGRETMGGRESEIWMRYLDQPRDAAIAAVGVAQHAVVGLEQLRALGLGPRAVQARASAGRLRRRFRGVYSIVPLNLLRREGHWMAAVLASGPGAVLSHLSAAALHGLRPDGGAYIDVTVPGRSGRRHPGVRVRRSMTLTESDITVVENIPCTTIARTMLDIADIVGGRSIERAFDQAEMMEAL